jgi:adenosylmethionine-8-amino-7-oxononanoate aminotransferase
MTPDPRHLWGHFSRISTDQTPVMVRGEGCYVWDRHGHRVLDGLSGLFCVQIGHGRKELAAAAAAQMEKLAFFPIWSYGNEPALALAERLSNLAPQGLDHVFFTDSGSAAVETAWKLARQYFSALGEPRRHKVISRTYTYHGTSLGALSITGIPAVRAPFEPLVPGAIKIQNTNHYRCHDCSHLDGCTLRCADDLALRIEMEGPETVAAVFMEPLQNTGGALAPPPGYFEKVREICDRYGILLVADEVICAFGRLGHWFGSTRYNYQPDMITFAKGVTSGYAPMGGLIVHQRVAEPFLDDANSFLHGMTFAGHPVSCANCSTGCGIFPSSATSAATDTSEPSNWCATRTPRKPSTRRTASGSCVRPSRLASTSSVCTVGPTIAPTPCLSCHHH